jgi:thiol:disulfide interchange protein DsbD
VASWLASKGLFLTLLLVFLAGIAASLTPCAYPSYLLIFGFFSGGEKKRSTGAGVLIAAAIVLGMMLSYSAAGIAAALGGGAVGRIMNNPWVMGVIAALFVGIGASSLGVLPPMEFAGIKNALHSKQKSNLVWALIFGLVMGLVVAPCVGPILIGILTYIASAGDLALGILLMSTFALGMGVLFFAMALFSQAIRTRLRMGRWNEFITVFFGIVFFAAALYYLKGVIPYERLFGIFVM